MPSIEVVDSGLIDRSDSAFPTTVRLNDGDLVCGFGRGGGAHVSGGTHCARSSDGGHTWSYQGAIVKPSVEPLVTNSLRLSRTAFIAVGVGLVAGLAALFLHPGF